MARTKKAKKRVAASSAPGNIRTKPSKKKKTKQPSNLVAGHADPAAVQANRATARERRLNKLEQRRKERRFRPTDAEWALPAPRGLVGRLERPKVISKHKTYFEFAENVERKDKKLEFEVTTNSKPPPGFQFIPVGNPSLTDACKDLSREREAMYFIVSSNRETNDRVYQYISRIGYHFRESIVDDAAASLGDTVVSRRVYQPNEIEPIPESQVEINQQADAAIRDLFPRIPNTDRQMIVDHAFKKGAQFAGQPTVGLAKEIPLSRRVQLAVLAHIRHNHTRYDLLLRETEWMNARKVVEPICLDILVKWRGDEETGRDQLEEILREVVVITDSEAEEEGEGTEEEDSSEDEGESDEDDEEEEEEEESDSSVSAPSISLPNSRNEHRSAPREIQAPKRGFHRYQAAWDQALIRQQENPIIPEAGHIFTDDSNRVLRSSFLSPPPNRIARAAPNLHHSVLPHSTIHDQQIRYDDASITMHQDYALQRAPVSNYQRDEVNVRPQQGYQPRTTQRLGPSVVVRASPIYHGLQDMLVPSIETMSSDVVDRSPLHDARHGLQPAYPQNDSERPLRSSPQRQVIVIDDDSPVQKRRRMVYEEDATSFRPFTSHVQAPISKAAPSGSRFLHASSVQQRDLLAQDRLPSHSKQGLFRDAQPPMSGSIIGGRLPVYDDQPQSRYSALPYDRYRRVEITGGSFQRERMEPQQRLEHRGGSFYNRLPANGDTRTIEHDRSHQVYTPYRDTAQRPLPAPFLVSGLRSRSFDIGGQPNLSSSHSQSRVEAPTRRTRDISTAISETSRRNPAPQESNQLRYEDPSIFTTLRPGEARAPVRYIGKPMRMDDERPPIFNDDRQSAPERYQIVDRRPQLPERLPPESDSPVYVRTVRRPLIVLE